MDIETGANDAVIPEQQIDIQAEPVETGEKVEVPAQPTEVPPQEDGKSAAWAELRRKAKAAEEYEKKLKEHEDKLAKLATRLPEGYSSIEEFLSSLDEPVEPTEPIEPKLPDVSSIVKKAIEELPEIRTFKQAQKDRNLVDSYTAAQKAFPDIKDPSDIPEQVWKEWDEGKSGRTLLSHLKEFRYDTDIAKTKQQAEAQAKQQVMSTAHTSQVQGTGAAIKDSDDVIVPDSVKKQLDSIGIKDPNKQKEYYKRFHRTE